MNKIFFIVTLIALCQALPADSSDDEDCRGWKSKNGKCFPLSRTRPKCPNGMVIGVNYDIVHGDVPDLRLKYRLTPYTVTAAEIVSGKYRPNSTFQNETRESDLNDEPESMPNFPSQTLKFKTNKWKYFCLNKKSNFKSLGNGVETIRRMNTSYTMGLCKFPHLISKSGVVSCRSCDKENSIAMKELATEAIVCVGMKGLVNIPVLIRSRKTPSLTMTFERSSVLNYSHTSANISTNAFAHLKGYPIVSDILERSSTHLKFRLQPIPDSDIPGSFVIKSYVDDTCLMPMTAERTGTDSRATDLLDGSFQKCNLDGAVTPSFTYNFDSGNLILAQGTYVLSKDLETSRLLTQVNPETNWRARFFKADFLSMDIYSNFRSANKK